MFFNNKFNTFFGLNLTLVYTFPMCMTWRFHFPLRNYDFNMWWCLGNRGNRVNVNWDDWGIVGMGLSCGGVWGTEGIGLM